MDFTGVLASFDCHTGSLEAWKGLVLKVLKVPCVDHQIQTWLGFRAISGNDSWPEIRFPLQSNGPRCWAEKRHLNSCGFSRLSTGFCTCGLNSAAIADQWPSWSDVVGSTFLVMRMRIWVSYACRTVSSKLYKPIQLYSLSSFKILKT